MTSIEEFSFDISISFWIGEDFKYGEHLFQDTFNVVAALKTLPTFEALVLTNIYVDK